MFFLNLKKRKIRIIEHWNPYSRVSKTSTVNWTRVCLPALIVT